MPGDRDEFAGVRERVERAGAGASYWAPVAVTADVRDNKLTTPCSGGTTYEDYQDCNFVSAKLGGSIYPGSDANLHYYFQYSNDPTFQCNQPHRPRYSKCFTYPERGSLALSGTQASGPIDLNPVCIGRPCPGETLQDNMSPSLQQPHEWFAQLVVTDGPHPPVKGGGVGFVPADQINPPLFDPRTSNPNGPGSQLKINCPSSCPELQFYTPLGFVQTSGSDWANSISTFTGGTHQTGTSPGRSLI